METNSCLNVGKTFNIVGNKQNTHKRKKRKEKKSAIEMR